MMYRKNSNFIKCIFSAVTSCIFSINVASANTPETLNVAYFHYPPFLIQGHTPSGFIIDIEKEIYEQAGYKLSFRKFPYPRALLETSKEKFDFCASLVPMAIKGLKYPESEVAELKTVFVIKKDNPWRYKGVDSLKGKTIGNIVSYDYSSISQKYNDYLKSNAANVKVLAGTNTTLRMLQMIDRGRIDTYSDSKSLIEYTISKNSLIDKFNFTGSLGSVLLTKPGFPEKAEKTDKLIAIFDQGMKRIRESGKLEKIMNKYGLKAWP